MRAYIGRLWGAITTSGCVRQLKLAAAEGERGFNFESTRKLPPQVPTRGRLQRATLTRDFRPA